MRKKLNNRRFTSLFFSLVLMTTFLAILSSCKKQGLGEKPEDNMQIQKFFPLSSIKDNDLKNFATEARSQNEKKHFIESFTKNNGYILWNDAQKLVTSQGIQALIPFALEGTKEVNGFIVAQKTTAGKYSFRTLRKDLLKKYGFDGKSKLNGFEVQSIINYFNFTLFNKNTFQIVDERQITIELLQKILKNGLNLNNFYAKIKFRESNKTSTVERTSTAGISCIFWDVEVEVLCWCGDESYSYTTTETHSFCWITYDESVEPDGWSGGSTGGGGPSGGGGGGGNPTPIFDPNNPFEHIHNSVDAPDEQLIENGIEVEDIPIDAPTGGTPRLIGRTQDRGNTEDLESGTDGDINGIRPSQIGKSNSELFDGMDNLFWWCTIRDNDLRSVGNIMIEKFRNNTSNNNIFTNPILNKKVLESNAMTNFLRRFGNELQSQLKLSGDINSIGTLNLGYRPIFNGIHNLKHGLQILINDTEYTEITLDKFELVPSGLWEADVTVTITDHFGLDKADALAFQYYDSGFADWWLLQHTRAFVPFQTKVVVRKRIRGLF